MSYAAAAFAGLQLANGVFQAETIREASALQQRINNFNAQYAELDSYNAWINGMSEASRYGTEAEKVTENQKVAFAVNDVDATYGTAAKVVDESKAIAFLNKLDLENKAFADASNYKRQAMSYRLGSQAINTQATINASAAQTTAIFNAGSTLISGYGKKK